jgi:hypothetical protein
MGKIFSTKISEHKGHLFEVGLLLIYDGIERSWQVEIRLLDPNGQQIEEGAIVLDEQFTEVDIADEAGVKAAHSLIDERVNISGGQ